MKKIFVSIILAAVLLSCTKLTQDDPVVPVEPVIPVPALTPEFDLGDLPESLILYPAVYDRSLTLSFSVTGVDERSTVQITDRDGVDATLECVMEDGQLTVSLTVSPTRTLAETGHGSLSLEARTGEKTATETLAFDEAYFRVRDLSFPGEGVTFDEETMSIHSDCEEHPDGCFTLETNLVPPTEAVSTEDWLSCTLSESGKWTVSLEANESEESRNASLLLSDGDGVLSVAVAVTQDGVTKEDDGGDEEGDDDGETEEEKSLRLEREALIAIWNSLGGENWPAGGGASRSPIDGKIYINDTKYWCTDEPVWVWTGVEVNKEGHVTELILGHELGVTGTIPEEIGNLKYLNYLDISEGRNGHVYGTLPESLGGLTKMARLWLLGCHLEGELETSPIRELVKNANRLVELNICGNNFTGGCPEWLGTMQASAYIGIGGNRLYGQVPQKVKDHPIWNSPKVLEDGTWGFWWQEELKQQEGYGLWI